LVSPLGPCAPMASATKFCHCRFFFPEVEQVALASGITGSSACGSRKIQLVRMSCQGDPDTRRWIPPNRPTLDPMRASCHHALIAPRMSSASRPRGSTTDAIRTCSICARIVSTCFRLPAVRTGDGDPTCDIARSVQLWRLHTPIAGSCPMRVLSRLVIIRH